MKLNCTYSLKYITYRTVSRSSSVQCSAASSRQPRVPQTLHTSESTVVVGCRMDDRQTHTHLRTSTSIHTWYTLVHLLEGSSSCISGCTEWGREEASTIVFAVGEEQKTGRVLYSALAFLMIVVRTNSTHEPQQIHPCYVVTFGPCRRMNTMTCVAMTWPLG